MSICLRHVKAFICNQFFFAHFVFVCSKKVDKRTNLIDSPIHGEHDRENFSFVHQSILKLQPY